VVERILISPSRLRIVSRVLSTRRWRTRRNATISQSDTSIRTQISFADAGCGLEVRLGLERE
jgi:hypothetical protein